MNTNGRPRTMTSNVHPRTGLARVQPPDTLITRGDLELLAWAEETFRAYAAAEELLAHAPGTLTKAA